MEGQFVSRAGTGGSAGDTGKINAVNEVLTCQTNDLSNIVLHLIQAVDAGTVTLSVEYSLDGTHWAIHTTKADTDFAAAANDVEVVTLSDANGMPIPAAAVRIKATAYAATGEYKLVVGGYQRLGFA